MSIIYKFLFYCVCVFMCMNVWIFTEVTTQDTENKEDMQMFGFSFGSDITRVTTIVKEKCSQKKIKLWIFLSDRFCRNLFGSNVTMKTKKSCLDFGLVAIKFVLGPEDLLRDPKLDGFRKFANPTLTVNVNRTRRNC